MTPCQEVAPVQQASEGDDAILCEDAHKGHAGLHFNKEKNIAWVSQQQEKDLREELIASRILSEKRLQLYATASEEKNKALDRVKELEENAIVPDDVYEWVWKSLLKGQLVLQEDLAMAAHNSELASNEALTYSMEQALLHLRTASDVMRKAAAPDFKPDKGLKSFFKDT